MSKSYEDLPPQQKQEIARLNQLQQQLDMIMQQRVSMEGSVKELESALKELESAGESAVCYKSIAGVFIKMDQKKLLEESKERKETSEMRIKSILNQEERLKKTYEDMRGKIQSMLEGK
jgi:prefoldin beta subunit